jgi:hypothetical protein
MTSLTRFTYVSTLVGLCLAAASGAYAQVSSITSAVVVPRVYNDVPGATGAYINTFVNPNVGIISLGETGMSAATGYADRDVWRFANGGGAYNFQNNDYFNASFSLQLKGSGTPGIDLEAGFLFSNPSGSFGGDSQFIVKPDGEVVQFGGISYAPFSPANGASLVPNYTLGTTYTLGMNYVLDPNTGNNAFQYSANGIFATSSGTGTTYFDFAPGLGIGNVAGNTLGGYLQIQNDPSNPGNNGTALFDITITSVPEPATFALVGMGLFGLLAIRRKR